MVRPVTKDGFRKLSLPADTYSWLRAWYMTQLETRGTEQESDAGPCMNQYAAPTAMAHVTDVQKQRLSRELQPLLREWYLSDSYYDLDYDEAEYTRRARESQGDEHRRMSGYEYRNTGDLVLTSIYGIRRYHNGSILRMHADTADTHVVSAIINVHQEGMVEDWPLLILDHQHREHNVSMRPGILCVMWGYIYSSVCLFFLYMSVFN